MPGFGEADDPPAGFEVHVGSYSNFIQQALEELGIERVHLVLHDFGGPFGLAWAAEHHESVASVTLIDTGVLTGYRWHYLARIWRTPVVGELFQLLESRRMFHRLLRHGNEQRPLPRPFVDRMFDDYDRETRRAVLRLYRSTGRPGPGRDRLTGVLRARDLPALVVWGKHDPYVPHRFAERQREVFPRAKVVVLEESGHWPFADDPEGTAAEVIPFLREQMVRP
jgi:pimeloyl-ACP methyl ester carboxylesterase